MARPGRRNHAGMRTARIAPGHSTAGAATRDVLSDFRGQGVARVVLARKIGVGGTQGGGEGHAPEQRTWLAGRSTPLRQTEPYAAFRTGRPFRGLRLTDPEGTLRETHARHAPDPTSRKHIALGWKRKDA